MYFLGASSLAHLAPVDRLSGDWLLAPTQHLLGPV